MYRVKILSVVSDVFPFPIQGIPGSRDKAMDVGMQREVLPPGVQHGHSTGFSAKMCVAERAKGLPNGRKKQAIIDPLVMQANGVQVVRYGKHQVVMLHG